MRITPPHWITAVFAIASVVATSLASTNSFPTWTPIFSALAATFAVLTAPSLKAKDPSQ